MYRSYASLLAFLFLGLVVSAQYPQNCFPFCHGVASGDALEDRVILWTRVSPQGNPAAVDVNWTIATDADMANVVTNGTFTTDASRDYTVKVDATGLTENTWYFYQFEAFGETSEIGRTQTIPSSLTSVSDFCFALASCANYEGGYFNAYGEIAKRNDLDAVFHVGDYFYEYGSGTYGSEGSRSHAPIIEVTTLDLYRARHANYKLDPDLQAAHRQYPWYMSWDDHETANNAWAGGAENHDATTEGTWEDRLDAALQAYYEWNPVRDIDLSAGIPAYRTINVGDLAKFYILETRLEARSEQVELPNVDQLYLDPATYLSDINNLTAIYTANQAAVDPNRTMLGNDQKNWLTAEMSSSSATWNVIVQQTVMAGLPIVDLTAPNPALGGASLADFFASQTGGLDIGSYVPLSYDNWDGYQADRFWLYGTMAALNVSNPVVLTGDIHSSYANTLLTDPTTFETIGAEFVTTQIAGNLRSYGVSDDSVKTLIPYIGHFRQLNNGFTVIGLNANQAQADYYNIVSTQGPGPEWNLPVGFTGIEDRVNYTLELDTSMVSLSDNYREFLEGVLMVDTIPRGVSGGVPPLACPTNPVPLADDSDNACGVDGTVVRAYNYAYFPADLTIGLGETVVWENENGTHNVDATNDVLNAGTYSNPENFVLAPVSANGSTACLGSYTFTVPGVYQYNCSVGDHAHYGMAGTITVGTGGCTDLSADNYDSTADFDDGTCSTNACVADLNEDGTVGAADMLLLLAGFGSDCE